MTLMSPRSRASPPGLRSDSVQFGSRKASRHQTCAKLARIVSADRKSLRFTWHTQKPNRKNWSSAKATVIGRMFGPRFTSGNRRRDPAFARWVRLRLRDVRSCPTALYPGLQSFARPVFSERLYHNLLRGGVLISAGSGFYRTNHRSHKQSYFQVGKW